MRVLVTGASGFIGSHVTNLLQAHMHDVVALDRNAANGVVLNPGSRGIWGHDLRYLQPRSWLSEIDAVIHLAGLGGTAQSWEKVFEYWMANVSATDRLIRVMKQAGVKRLIHISSSSVYGKVATGDEDSSTIPASPYGVTKLAGERLAYCLCQHFGIDLTIIRPFTVYGPGQRKDMIHNIVINRLLQGLPIIIEGDGKQSRGCTFVKDIAKAIIMTLEKPEAIGRTYNVGGNEPISIIELVHLAGQLIGITPTLVHTERRPGDQDITIANTQRIESELGWKALTSLAEGMELQLLWQREAANG